MFSFPMKELILEKKVLLLGGAAFTIYISLHKSTITELCNTCVKRHLGRKYPHL